MTETEWRTCDDPDRMLAFLQDRASDRKLRLFAVACCRRVWDRLPALCCRDAVVAAERFADGLLNEHDLGIAHRAASEAASCGLRPLWTWSAGTDAFLAALAYFSLGKSWTPALAAAAYASGSPHLPAPTLAATAADAAADALIRSRRGEERQYQAALLREIIGDPFRKVVAWPAWSVEITSLAQTLYGGDPVEFALHDALLEAGFAELAHHFQSKSHPRGCWALDVILGKN